MSVWFVLDKKNKDDFVFKKAWDEKVWTQVDRGTHLPTSYKTPPWGPPDPKNGYLPPDPKYPFPDPKGEEEEEEEEEQEDDEEEGGERRRRASPWQEGLGAWVPWKDLMRATKGHKKNAMEVAVRA